MELLAPEAVILALFLGLLAPARPKHQAIAMETIACSHMCIENAPERLVATLLDPEKEVIPAHEPIITFQRLYLQSMMLAPQTSNMNSAT